MTEAPRSESASRCPRCEASFGCGVDSGSCWCADVVLDGAVRSHLASFYDGCLCPDCLKTIEETRPVRMSVREFLASQLRRKYGRPAPKASPKAE